MKNTTNLNPSQILKLLIPDILYVTTDCVVNYLLPISPLGIYAESDLTDLYFGGLVFGKLCERIRRGRGECPADR